MYCKTEKVDIYYEIIGEGQPILMLHGYYPDHRLMKGCMEPIFAKRAGWKRIYLDLPGMGKTKAADSIKNGDQMLDIVLEFIEKILPKEKFLLAGESFGGYLARGIILKKFDYIDGMFLICPSIIRDSKNVPPHQVFKKDNSLLEKLSTDERKIFETVSVIQDKRNWVRFNEEVLPGLEAADEKFLVKLRKKLTFSFAVDKLPKPFEKPSLILAGRQDSMVGYKDIWDILDNYPRCTFAVLDVAGHALQIEQEELFNAFVNEWLDRIENKK